MLRPLAQSAKRAGDSRMLMELGHAALRLDEHQLGVELFHKARGEAGADEWRGEPLDSGTLAVHLIEKASQGVGAGVELAGYVRAAAACGAHHRRRRAAHGPAVCPHFAGSDCVAVRRRLGAASAWERYCAAAPCHWPYLSREVPCYPGAIVIGKNDRPWDIVFDEIIAIAKTALEQPRA